MSLLLQNLHLMILLLPFTWNTKFPFFSEFAIYKTNYRYYQCSNRFSGVRVSTMHRKPEYNFVPFCNHVIYA